jgi:protein-tyrosine-phosphatase
MTKYLFVCHANIGRSQMAEGFAKLRGLEARSAGVCVGHPGQKLSDFPDFVRLMEEVNYSNFGDHERKQLTLEMVDWADKVVVMVYDNFWPDYLVAAKDKIVFHDVDDPGQCGNYGNLCCIRDKIKGIVEGLEK